MQVITPVLTIFVLMALGFLSVRAHVLDDHAISGISAFVLYFAQPCLILAKLQQDVTPSLLLQLGQILLLTCVVMGLSGLAAWQLFRRQSRPRRAVLANMVMASNCGFMGYPVISAVVGDDHIIYAVMYVTAFNLVCWTLGVFFFRGKGGISGKQLLLNPTIWAVIGGMVLLLTGWRLPSFLNSAVSSMGDITTPAAMFVIGARLVGLRPRELRDPQALLACALRLIAVPLGALALVSLLPVGEGVRCALYICSMMPCASLTGMQADVFDSEPALASRGIAVSTAISLVTVPLMLLLY